MDAIELLKHDHRRVEQLFRDYHAAASDTQRRGVVEILVHELSAHAALEELLVYPLAREEIPGGGQLADRHLAEHADVKKTLLALDRLGAGDERADALMAQLEREIEEHVREEEDEFLPRLRDAVGPRVIDELGHALKEARRTAPTRPHPHAPDQPPALALAGPVAAVYDRVRDRLQGRPRP
ncbi:hemerythrin domain-containing protein [Streptomyces aidingensis]|uniref:Hemerythrin HHE cation binding domain-containing protein n=1 Tax=Streptomyces aidingensis TaxID=910347 RepID=A0A1I1V8I5_9ACTN|nr:hemerythrin domain-containing protein [Streptomyces aidingensis]SFD79135.1 Hemerythrin HHE cation binding domain-containing protein [Streptomyces aidingensis]